MCTYVGVRTPPLNMVDAIATTLVVFSIYWQYVADTQLSTFRTKAYEGSSMWFWSCRFLIIMMMTMMTMMIIMMIIMIVVVVFVIIVAVGGSFVIGSDGSGIGVCMCILKRFPPCLCEYMHIYIYMCVRVCVCLCVCVCVCSKGTTVDLSKASGSAKNCQEGLWRYSRHAKCVRKRNTGTQNMQTQTHKQTQKYTKRQIQTNT